MAEVEAPVKFAPARVETPAAPPAIEARHIALELARILQEEGLVQATRHLRPDWIDLDEAAEIFGYSVSRFYHVYGDLGLVPSRTSKRKLRFNRQEIEAVLRDRQKGALGRPRRTVTRERK